MILKVCFDLKAVQVISIETYATNNNKTDDHDQGIYTKFQ